MKIKKTVVTQGRLELAIVEQGLVGSSPNEAEEAEIGKDIKFDLGILNTYAYNGWKPLHEDLLLVCAAIEYADRRVARGIRKWSRQFSIVVPVHELDRWKQPSVSTSLTEALNHLTGDEWRLSFVRAKNPLLDPPQRPLPLGFKNQFVMAYSNGLDSRCVSGLLDINGTAVRVRVSKRSDEILQGEQSFDQVPYKVKAPANESSMRSRGFKFAAITAIAGNLFNVKKIIFPESGQGVFGPVLLPLHRTYADYRNHPTFFRKMEAFVEALLGYDISYEQPRIWHTKGETISAFLAQSRNGHELILSTRSCWQERWNVHLDGKRRQCGLCAACLLRRMSMHFAGVEEASDAYVFTDLTQATYQAAIPKRDRIPVNNTMLEYGVVGARHLDQLASMAALADRDLEVHVFEIARALGQPERETNRNLKKLLSSHSNEWDTFIKAQGKRSFIKEWIAGGRNG